MDNQPSTSSQSSPSSTSHTSFNSSSFILRKKFNYKTKYNLTSLLKELEIGLRETCKPTAEIAVNYFSFSSVYETNDLKRRLSMKLNQNNKPLYTSPEENFDR